MLAQLLAQRALGAGEVAEREAAVAEAVGDAPRARPGERGLERRQRLGEAALIEQAVAEQALRLRVGRRAGQPGAGDSLGLLQLVALERGPARLQGAPFRREASVMCATTSCVMVRTKSAG